MKALILLTFLATYLPLSAGYEPARPLSFEYNGKLFNFGKAINLPSGIWNTYRTLPAKPGEIGMEINCAFVKTPDCSQYATNYLSSAKKQLPGVGTLAFNQNDKTFAGFSIHYPDVKNGAHNVEFWSLRKQGDFPFASLRTLKTIDPTDGALEKIKETLPTTTETALNEILETEIPPIILPRRKGTTAKVEGTTTSVNQDYLGKIFEGDGKPPELGVDFEITIPTRYAKKTGVMGKERPPYLFGYGHVGTGGKLIESVRFSNLSHAVSADTLPILPFVTMLIETQAVDAQVSRDVGGRIMDRYETNINGTRAAVIVTEITRTNSRPIYRQYIMIPRPNSDKGILIETFIDAQRSSEINSREDLHAFKGFAGEIIASFSFKKIPTAE
ncbi:hypothetical protein [Luteolibacter sp. AS25]|uniref:hypothetical protein n=1 Tax=Luteolibacter sp. AS25 TaxID=3135776 RepID=UPI00398B2C92